MQNEDQHITDVETTEEYLFEDTIESDTSAVTEISDTGGDDVSSVSEVSETTEAVVSSPSDVQYLEGIYHNTSGILLMVTAIFFAVVIAFIAKIFGGYFSM